MEENICAICGGLLRIDYTITFAECRPQSMRVEPRSPLKLCPGHAATGSATGGDWDELSADQQYDVDQLRRRISDYLIAHTELFYKAHPELRLTWSMTLDALIREKNPVNIQEA